jgi:hypothetical protein
MDWYNTVITLKSASSTNYNVSVILSIN